MNIKTEFRIPNASGHRYVWYAAAPINGRMSFSGSGLPFPSQEMAFDHTPNIGRGTLDQMGHAEVELILPGSYMDNGKLIPPTLFVYDFNNKQTHMFYLRPSTKYRAVTYPSVMIANRSLFYNPTITKEISQMTQAERLVASGYNTMKDNPNTNPIDSFWGYRSPK